MATTDNPFMSLYTLYAWFISDKQRFWRPMCQGSREYVEQQALDIYPRVKAIRIYNPRDEIVLERGPVE
jgi:hypothetical protein